MSDDLDVALKLAREGDREAFGRLYHAYAGSLFAYLSTRTRRPEDAEDLVAQCFMEAMRDLGRFEGDVSGFRAWLFRIGQMRAIDLARQRDRRREESIDEAADHADPTQVDEAAMAAVQRQRLWAAVKRLPDLQQRVLVLRLGSGLSSSEIAKLLGRSTGGVKALQHRALVKLAKDMGVPKGFQASLQD